MGLPIGIQNVFMSGLSLIISSIVARWGADAIAVQKVGSQVESLAWMISGGFSMAVNAFIGQNYGAKKLKRVKGAYKMNCTPKVGQESQRKGCRNLWEKNCSVRN